MRRRLFAAALAVLGLLASSSAAAAGRAPSGPDWRQVDPNNLLVIDTTKGRVLVEMVPEVAPNHVARIRKLAQAGTYDGLTFFRVIDWFMDQTGDPKNTGEGGTSEPNLKAEFTFRRDAATPFAAASAPTGAETGFVRSLPVISQTPAATRRTSAMYCPA